MTSADVHVLVFLGRKRRIQAIESEYVVSVCVSVCVRQTDSESGHQPYSLNQFEFLL